LKNYDFVSCDYKSKFRAIIDDLFARAKRGEPELADRQSRMRLIEALTNAYITQTGERPDHTQLDRLATLILREELTDDDPYKMSHEEDPILSDTQRGRRYKREKTKEDVITGRDKVIGYKRSWYETEDGEIREVRQKIYEYNAKHP
jgi:hypothetical protein